MKFQSISLTFLYLCFSFLNLQAQDSDAIEWAPIGATWHYQIRLDQGQPAVSWIKLQSDRDTVIDGDLFKVIKIETTYNDRFINNYFLLKQLGERLYFRTDSIDHLIYDFSLSVGDTLIVKNPIDLIHSIVDLPYDTLVIEEIESIEINGQNRRKQVVKSSALASDYGPILIEGIGSIGFWFFPTYTSAEDIDVIDGFRCYEDDQIGLYQHTEVPCDFDNVFVPTSNFLSFPLDIFPNPFIDQVSIRCSDCVGLRFQIIDVLGQVYDYGFISDPLQTFDLGPITSKFLIARIGDETKGYALKKILSIH